MSEHSRQRDTRRRRDGRPLCVECRGCEVDIWRWALAEFRQLYGFGKTVCSHACSSDECLCVLQGKLSSLQQAMEALDGTTCSPSELSPDADRWGPDAS